MGGAWMIFIGFFLFVGLLFAEGELAKERAQRRYEICMTHHTPAECKESE